MTALDTNVLIYDSVKPRSRAADATVLPSSRTSRTAPVL